MSRLCILMIGLGLLASCKQSNDAVPHPVMSEDSTFHMSYQITSLEISSAFAPAKKVGTVRDFALDEISGIGLSRQISHAFWSEEDSGNENKIYLLDSSGVSLATIRITSIDDRDWEDLSIAPGPIEGVSYVYLAETGDNHFAYSTKYIYRFPEPDLSGVAFPYATDISKVDVIPFQYPDGIKNAEAIMIDPITKDIYIISKESAATVYVLTYPQTLDQVTKAVKLGTLPFSTVTAADISPDGTGILIKNYTDVLYWKREPAQSIFKTLQTIPAKAPYTPEQKGESIAWAADASGYYTTSERVDSTTPLPVYFYQRIK